MDTIDFSRHYAKLDCREGHIFTTIRRYSTDNVRKYLNKEGTVYMITVNAEYFFDAKLLFVTYIDHLFSLSKHILVYDTAYYSLYGKDDEENSIANLILEYKDDPIMLLILQKVTK